MVGHTIEEITGKPLYCFKVSEQTLQVERIEIPSYTLITSCWSGKKEYRFSTPKITKTNEDERVNLDKLDRFVADKVYSFNPDVQNAKRIMLERILEEEEKARNNLQKWSKTREQFLQVNPEFDNMEEI